MKSLWKSAALLLAVALKGLLSNSPVESLQWLMAPAVQLMSWVTGFPFFFENSIGYVSTQARYAVVPACSGLNFLVVAFGLLAWSFLSRDMKGGRALVWAGVLALPLTYLTNATRLAIAVTLHQRVDLPPFLTGEMGHRLLGVGIYTLALLLVAGWASQNRLPRRVLLTWVLGWYWLFTLVLPLLNGAASNRLFMWHAAGVLSGSLLVGAVYVSRFYGKTNSHMSFMRPLVTFDSPPCRTNRLRSES